MTHDCYSTKRVTVWDETRENDIGVPTPGKAIKYQDGYQSWCPNTVFDRDYQPTTAMSFGHAIHALKAGHRVARVGWNGNGMWLALSCGDMTSSGDRDISADKFWSPHNAAYARECGGFAVVAPCITMKTADGKILMGWLASQTDILADDWQLVD